MKNIIPTNIEAVFLDFDGVVVESANIKTDAFYELYLSYGEDIATKAKDYHLQNQGVSRFKKFEFIHNNFLGKKCENFEKEELSIKFSKIVLEKILICGFVKGILGFLKILQTRNIPVFLLSATPEEELLNICANRDISKYFKEIFGSPNEKSEIGKKIITLEKFKTENVVFIGDSISDYNAAKALKVNFIGRVPENESNPFENSIPIIENFEDIVI